jgi:hypothetical protein
MRKALPIALVLSVALLGCTTNRTPGNGEPVTATPSMGPATTPGSSSGNVPMTSSYRSTTTSRLSADEAAALMRERQAYQGRFLGYLTANGAVARPATAAAMQQPTGQFISPAAQVNPQITVNSSISSQPTPVVNSGAGDASGAAVAAATTGAFVVPGGTTTTATTAGGTAITGGVTLGTTSAAPTIASNVTTPTIAATTATPTTAATANTLTPTVTSGATASPIAATGTILPGATTVTGSVISTGSTTSAAATTPTTVTSASVSKPLVIQPSNANGTPITVSNTGGQITISNVRIK